jgi:uncharacterized protein YbjT (DUF2867 family)
MKAFLMVVLMLGSTTNAVAGGDSVLVFGGTGRLGAPIVRQLADAGYQVTVFARPTSDRSRLSGLDVTYVTGDLTEADSVTRAIDGRAFRFVIDASAGRLAQPGFYSSAMRNMLAALAGSAVQQFILHGSVGAGDNVKHFPEVPFGRMLATLQDKGEAEALLKASSIPYTIIRNGRVLTDGTPATGSGRLTEDDSVLASITRPDLAMLTMRCLANPDCLGKTYHAVDDSLR